MKTIEKVKSEREHDVTDKRRQGDGRHCHQPVVPVPRSTARSRLFENDALDFVPDVVETIDDRFEVIVDLLAGYESHRV